MSRRLTLFTTRLLVEAYFLKGKIESVFKTDIYEKVILKALQYILNTYKKSKPSVLTSFFVPAEIFHVFKVAPISCEYIAPLLAVADRAIPVLEATEKEGFSTDMCSFHRAVLGAHIKGFLPKYSLIVATSHLCDGQNKTLEEIALKDNSLYVLLDVPQIDCKDSRIYLAEQIKELCEILKEITGYSPTTSDWKRVFTHSNNARRFMIRINKKRYNLIGNLFGQRAFNFTLLSWLMLGSEFLERITYELDRSLKDMKKGNFLKVVWLLSYPYYAGNFAERLEEMGILGVADELSYVFWNELDYRKPYLSLAEKMLKNPNLGPIGNRLSLVKQLVKESKPDGVIHFSHWGCRQGCGGVKPIAELLDEMRVPFLEIHGDCIDKRHRSSGQLTTRIHSFIELMSKKKSMGQKKKTSGLFLGIDIGSMTAKAVILDEKNNILFQKILYTGSSTKRTVRLLEEEIFTNPEFKGKIKGCVSTGYGRFSVGFADENITEITCHAKGMSYQIPGVRTLIDIGGQDTKVISLGPDGGVVKFVMNDKCAAGTGRFLEIMARTLEVDIEDLGKLCLNSKKEVTISSMCSVFAESEVISLIAENVNIEDIARAICNSIARRTSAMVERVGKIEKVAMSGGVAKNSGVVKELEKALKTKIHIPCEPQIIGALGAALIAKEKTE